MITMLSNKVANTVEISTIDNMTIKHDGFKIHYVKCLKTGKFLKHYLAMNALYEEFISTVMVLSTCVISLVMLSLYLLCK